VITAAGLLLVVAGCSTEAKYKWLSTLFDGVPDPNAPKQTNRVVIQYDDKGNPLATEMLRLTNNSVVKAPPFTTHPPYEDHKCTECHLSEFSVRMKAPQKKVCFDCHDTTEAVFVKSKFKHQPVDNGECTTCHNPHGSALPKMLKGPIKTLCTDCHEDPIGKKAKSSHVPFENGECVSCHSPHASPNKGLLAKPVKNLCADCHDEPKPKPKVIHPPLENGECLACHAPHASVNKSLLAKAGKANCFECHDDFLEKAKFKHTVVDDCSACHNSHGAAEKGLLIKNSQLLCAECHEPKDMAAVKGHANIGDIACLKCHGHHTGDAKFLLKPDAAKIAAELLAPKK